MESAIAVYTGELCGCGGWYVDFFFCFFYLGGVRSILLTEEILFLLHVLGLCLIGFVENVGVRYFGVFLAAIPSTANGPCILTWQANNVRGISLFLSLCPLSSAIFTNQPRTNQTKKNTGQWKRALVSALSVGLGAIGGVTGYVLLLPPFLLLLLFFFSSSSLIHSSISSLSIIRNHLLTEKCQFVKKIDPWYFELKINPIIHPESRRVLPQRDSSW